MRSTCDYSSEAAVVCAFDPQSVVLEGDALKNNFFQPPNETGGEEIHLGCACFFGCCKGSLYGKWIVTF